MDPQVLREAMTAYQAVYDEDLRETIEFENWVNALLDEGHDLSDYTWEDMYEAYVEEQGVRTGSNPNVYKPTPSAMGSRRGAAATPSGSSSGSVSTQRGRVTGSNPNVFKPATTTSGPAGGGMGGRRGGGSSPGSLRPSTTAAPTQSKFAGARDAAFARARQITGTSSAPAAATKPAAAPAARPTATAAPRPTATSPTKPAPTATAKPANAMQTAASNLSGTGALASAPKKPSLASQAAELRSMQAASRQRQGLTQGFDMFDVVKGHLLDEGYADTEEAALAIMANMSEEWRESIVEAKYGTKEGRKALAKKIRKGEEVGKSGPGTGFKAVEKAAKEGGADNPKAVAAAAMWKTYGGKKG